MKHKLLSLIALAGAMFMSTGAMAWDAPVKPKVTFTGTTVAPEAGGTYFILNVGTGQFLGCGNDWGTRCVATVEKVLGVDDEQITCTANKNYVLPFTLEAAERPATAESGEFFFIRHLNTNKVPNNYLAHEGNSAWVDADEGRRETDNNGYWQIEKVNDVYHLLPFDAPDVDQETGDEIPFMFGISETSYGDKTSYTWTDGKAAGKYWVEFLFIAASEKAAVETFIAETYPAYALKVQAYLAKYDLLDALNAADEAGVSTDAAAAVYNNPDATLQQIKDATATLMAAIEGSSYDFSGASETNPLDVTDQVLKNPDFEEEYEAWKADIPGWTITVGAQNKNLQETAGTVDEEKGYVRIDHFIESWNGSALGDGDISQTVYGLPKGKYVLECDAFTGQGNKTFEGVSIFIESNSGVRKEPINTPEGQPMHFSVTFVNPGSPYLTFGLRAESTNANWMGADNFKLYYLGETTDTPESVALKDAIEKAKVYTESGSNGEINGYEDNNFAADVRSELESAISTGESALNGTAADQTAATEAINAAIVKVEASKKVYAQYKQIYADADKKLEDINDNWTGLVSSIESWMDGLASDFQSGALTEAGLEEAQNKVSQLIREFVAGGVGIEAGDDITLLMVNPGFDSSIEGWTVKSGATPTISSGLAEVYTQAFDIHQVIPNMPAGVYEVSLQGFTRNQPGGNRMAFTPEDQTGTTFEVYTPLLGAKVQNILAGASTELIAQRGDETDPSSYIGVDGGDYDIAADIDGTVYYMPNGMASARKHFDQGRYQTTLRVVLAEAGDLDLGIRCTSTQEWCLWDELKLVYAGEDNSVFADMVRERQTELQTLYDAKSVDSPEAIATDVERLVTEQLTFDANSVEDIDAAKAAVAKIDEAMAKLNESIATYQSLGQILEYFYTLMEEVNVNEAFVNLYGAVYDRHSNGYYSTLAAMAADEKALIEGWAGAVCDEFAADDDATAAILNPDYSGLDGTGGANFWTSEPAQPGVNFNECEFFNREAFNHFQTLKGLKPGYYTVSVDGFYRYGDFNPNPDAETPGAANAHTNGTEQLNAVLYVNSADGSNSVALKSIFEGAQSEAYGAGDERQPEGFDGYIPNSMEAAQNYLLSGSYTISLNVKVAENDVLTIGVRKSQGIANDWTIFSNWTLTYLGTEAPVAVESIEAQTAGIETIYGIDGRQQSQLRRGVNIVRKSGKVSKVLVK